ncbi:DUF6029 family protein [Wenyingzhuangia sp. IMCC45533]
MRILHLISAFLFVGLSYSQALYTSAGFESNAQYYVDDPKTGDFLESHPFRSNNYLKLEASLDNFYVGAQVESYAPMALLNYSPEFENKNLGLYYAGYKTQTITFTAGHFYEQFGSGLILRFWEDRQLGINNALRGVKVKLNPHNGFSVTALAGKQRLGFGVSQGVIYGIDSEFNLSKALNFNNSALINLGVSYVGRSQEKTNTHFNYDQLTNLIAARFEVSKGSFYVNTEYVHKQKDAIYLGDEISNAKEGNAALINMGYARKGLGIDATLRRTENLGLYANRAAAGNIFNESLVNYIPALTKQHDYLLTNIYVYQSQSQISFQDQSLIKTGEIGGQIDLYYQINKNTFLGGKYGMDIALNTSAWYGLDGKKDFKNTDYNNRWIGVDEKYYSDFSLEIRKKWSHKWNTIFYFVHQYYNTRFIEETFGEVNASIWVSEAVYRLENNQSLRFEAQYLSTKDDQKDWVGGTVEFHASSSFSFYVNDIYNFGNESAQDRIHYYNAGGSYTVNGHRFSLNYGRQRGGLICVGGVCRFVPESTGITANVIMSF